MLGLFYFIARLIGHSCLKLNFLELYKVLLYRPDGQLKPGFNFQLYYYLTIMKVILIMTGIQDDGNVMNSAKEYGIKGKSEVVFFTGIFTLAFLLFLAPAGSLTL